jgi:hypothetical protein
MSAGLCELQNRGSTNFLRRNLAAIASKLLGLPVLEKEGALDDTMSGVSGIVHVVSTGTVADDIRKDRN